MSQETTEEGFEIVQEDGNAEDTSEVEGTDTDAEGWTPPTREEFEATQAALKRANAEAAERRIKLKELEEKNKTTEEKEADKTRDEVTAEVSNRYKKPLVRTALKDAMSSGNDLETVLSLIKLDEVTLDDDGNVSGLDEQIRDLKSRLPGLFAQSETKTTPPTVARNGGRAPERPLTASEKQAQQLGLFGKR